MQTSGSLKDTQSGFRAYPVAVLNWLKLHDKGFSFEVEVLVKSAWAGIEIKEVDVSVQYLPSRERVSHFHLVKDNLALSLLNTRLTMRAVLPLPQKRFLPSKDGLENISIFHPMKSLRILSRNTSPDTAGGIGRDGRIDRDPPAGRVLDPDRPLHGQLFRPQQNDGFEFQSGL